jgi:uncharacterized protein (DUF58 family)
VSGPLKVLLALCLLVSIFWREPLTMLLTALLGLLAATTWLWARFSLSEVTYRRHFGTERLFPGEETSLTIEVTNAKPLPLPWLRCEDEWPAKVLLPGHPLVRSHKPERRELVHIWSLRFYQRVRKHYRIRAEQRGVMEFGPVGLRSSDLFGFKNQERVSEEIDRLVVYPALRAVEAPGLLPAHPPGDGKTSFRLLDDPLRIQGARHYAPGDPRRFVHWKVSAHTGELHSKVFEPAASQVVELFLDLQTVKGAPGIDPEILELLISAAASLTSAWLDERLSVGLTANGARINERDLATIRPSRQAQQLTEVLETLAWLNGHTSVPTAEVVRNALTVMPFGASVVLLGAMCDAEQLAALTDVRRSGHPVALVLVGDDAVVQGLDGLRVFRLTLTAADTFEITAVA